MMMFNPPHPGISIKESLDYLGLSINAYAKLIDVSPSTVQRVIVGKSSISPELALRLAKTIGSTAGSWLRRQAAYDAWQIEHNSDVDLSRLSMIPDPHAVHIN